MREVNDLATEFFQEEDRILFFDVVVVVDEGEWILLRIDFPTLVVVEYPIQSLEFYGYEIVIEAGD